ncbi:MAG: hypothetical protein ACXAD7_14840 [Candidatus Kariarchaeaceae archaeon]
MRHVILGSNTLMGASIVRVLETLGGHEIIACSPTGEMEEGIISRSQEVIKVDNLDPYSLMDVLKEGDIVYNAQILEDEDVSTAESDLYHSIGWINLLGIATHKKIGKIVGYMPQLLGWKTPLNSMENTKSEKTTPYQRSLIEMLNISGKYWNSEDYGWSDDLIQDLVDKSVLTNTSESDPQSSAPTSPASSGPQAPSSGPTPPALSGPQAPSSGPTPPALSGPQAPSSGPTPPVSSGPQAPSSPAELTLKEEDGGRDEQQSAIDRIPLVIARVARFFGPHDNVVTREFCRAVRLQRIEVVGKINKQVSWINPMDAARALIIIGDNPITEGQFLINGFNASPIELLTSLDQLNHSQITIKHRSLFLEKIKYQVNRLLKTFRLSKGRNLSELLRLNCAQLFDDQLARETWGWKPRFGMRETAKESLGWYVSHVIGTKRR